MKYIDKILISLSMLMLFVTAFIIGRCVTAEKKDSSYEALIDTIRIEHLKEMAYQKDSLSKVYSDSASYYARAAKARELKTLNKKQHKKILEDSYMALNTLEMCDSIRAVMDSIIIDQDSTISDLQSETVLLLQAISNAKFSSDAKDSIIIAYNDRETILKKMLVTQQEDIEKNKKYKKSGIIAGSIAFIETIIILLKK